jgi:hypothetical protein
VYYARLNTPVGILYKLGFTTMNSVEERLGYQANGDLAYLDRTLFLLDFNNAFEIETAAHEHFAKHLAFGIFSADQDMPLFKNGQSELYVKDILGLDAAFTNEQYEAALVNIGLRKPGYRPHVQRTVGLKEEIDFLESRRRTADSWLSRAFRRLDLLLASQIERKRLALVDELMERALLWMYLDACSLLRKQRLAALKSQLRDISAASG